MQDTIIKGNGRSRSIRSVPNLAELAPTYEDFLKLFAGDGVPVDLGPLDPAGLKRRGTDLNKATLLADETAKLYGKDAAAVPDEIFAAIRPLISAAQGSADLRSQMAAGSYDGEYPGGEKKTLSFNFEPKIIVVCFGGHVESYHVDAAGLMIAIRGVPFAPVFSTPGNNYSKEATGAAVPVEFDGKSVTYPNLNMQGNTYCFAVFG